MWKFSLALGVVGQDVFEKPKTAKYDAGGGIAKVVKMLYNMKKEIGAANDRDKRMYDQFACFCKEEGAARGEAIENAKSRLSELTIALNGESSIIEEAENKIKMAESAIAKQKKKQGELTGVMNQDDEDYAKRKAASVETLNVVSRGIEALKKGGRNSFLQLSTAEKAEYSKTLSLVEQLTGKSVNEGGIGQVIGYLQELKKSTAVELQSDASDNMAARTTYHESMLLSMQLVAQNERVKAINEKKKAENMKLKGEDMAEYAAVKEKMDVDVEFFDNMQADCKARSKFYTENVGDANEEVAAIEKAIPPLEALISGPSFLQQRSLSSASVSNMLSSRSEKIAVAVHRMSKKTSSNVMPIFAFLAQSESGKAALSATQKIVTKCEGMIADLKAEIKVVEKKKATCVAETQKLNMAMKVAAKEKQSADDTVLATQTAISVTEEAIEKTQREIAENNKAQEYLKEQCKKLKEELKKNIAQLEEEIAGVDQAIGFLSEIYGAEAVAALKDHQRFKADYNDKYGDMESEKASTGKQDTEFTDHKKRRQGGSAILIMLQTISDSLVKNKKDSAAELEDTKAECKKESEELKRLEAALKATFTELKDKLSGLSAQLAQDISHQSDMETNLNVATTALSDYGNCAQRTHEYDNAISAKQIDIDGLVTVIQVLKSIASGTDEAVSLADITPSEKALMEIDNFTNKHTSALQ